MTAGLIIFAATYLLIAVQRLPFVHLNRPAASLLGAVAMVLCGVLTLPQAYAAIDFDVLVFLLGLMLVVGYLEVGGFFEWAAEWVLRRSSVPVLTARLPELIGGTATKVAVIHSEALANPVRGIIDVLSAGYDVVAAGRGSTAVTNTSN